MVNKAQRMLWPAWSDGYRRVVTYAGGLVPGHLKQHKVGMCSVSGNQGIRTDPLTYFDSAFAKSISIRLSQGSSHSWRHTEMLEVSWTCTNGIRGSSVMVCRLGASKVMDRTLTYHSVATKLFFFLPRNFKSLFSFFFLSEMAVLIQG